MRFPSVSNLSILRQGLLLLAIPCVFQVGFLLLLFETNRQVTNARYWAVHSKEVIANTETLYRKLVEAHGAVRGFLLTDSEIFSRQVASTLAGIDRSIGELRGKVEDNEPQIARVDELGVRGKALMEWQIQTIDLYRTGEKSRAMENVRNLSGKRLLDQLRESIDAFLDAETSIDRDRDAQLASLATAQTMMMTVGGLLVLLLTVGFAALIGRGITGRFRVLNENVARLAEGKDLSEPLDGRDELAQLDRVFHGMARAIEEKNRENELFIYSVSHDLRSPLVNLQGFSQELGHAARGLREAVSGGDVPDATRKKVLDLIEMDVDGSIHFIQTAVSRLSAIIDALLRLSRVGRVEYRWQMVDLDVTASRIVEALGVTIAERGAKVEVEALPPAWGDPTAVEQVFANLIGNAVNYLDPSRPGVVRVGTSGQTAAGSNLYYVSDNGRGIPASGISKLFLAFQRFHEGAARGEGIGLALVRRIVERHGGKIRVESKEGEGSTFFVELPAKAPEHELGRDARRIAEGKEAFA